MIKTQTKNEVLFESNLLFDLDKKGRGCGTWHTSDDLSWGVITVTGYNTGRPERCFTSKTTMFLVWKKVLKCSTLDELLELGFIDVRLNHN